MSRAALNNWREPNDGTKRYICLPSSTQPSWHAHLCSNNKMKIYAQFFKHQERRSRRVWWRVLEREYGECVADEQKNKEDKENVQQLVPIGWCSRCCIVMCRINVALRDFQDVPPNAAASASLRSSEHSVKCALSPVGTHLHSFFFFGSCWSLQSHSVRYCLAWRGTDSTSYRTVARPISMPRIHAHVQTHIQSHIQPHCSTTVTESRMGRFFWWYKGGLQLYEGGERDGCRCGSIHDHRWREKGKRSSGGLTVGTYSEGNLLVVYEMSKQV